MKKFSLFLLGSSLLFLTSCFDIIEEIYLNKDGSGQYITQFDMSSLMDNPLMKEAFAKSEGEGEAIEMNIDSIMYLKDSQGFETLSATEQSKIGNTHLHMLMNEKDKKMLITMVLPFNHLNEIDEINDIMEKLDKKKTAKDGGNDGLFGGGNLLSNKASASFTLEKRKLIRLPSVSIKELFGDSDEEVEMAKMFLEGATTTTIYHLPGKVKKCTIPNAIIDGKTVTVKSSILDIINNKVTIDGFIKYRRR